MNWLDIVLLLIILVSLVFGIIKGLFRQVVGIIAVLAGLVLAALYCKGAGNIIDSVIHNELFADFLGFILIFVLALIAGALLGYMVTKSMKGKVETLNRVLGGLFGFLKGVLICGIIVFAFQSFKVARPAMATSKVAPVSISATRFVINLIPQDVKNKIDSSYREIRNGGGRDGQKI